MSFTKQLRSWFFRSGAPINPNVSGDLKDHFADRGAPSQGGSFEPLMASTPFFTEADDRAKLSTGGARENEVGLSAVNPDADVITYTDGLRADRTLVPTAKNLTEVATSGTVDTIPLTNDVPAYADTIVEIDKDLSETKRNKFFPQIKATFITWLTTNVLPRLIPIGGADEYVLAKASATNYDVEWVPQAALATRTVHVEDIGWDGTYTYGTNSEDILYVVGALPAVSGTQVFPTVILPAAPVDGDVVHIKTSNVTITAQNNITRIATITTDDIENYQGSGSNQGVQITSDTGVRLEYVDNPLIQADGEWKVVTDYVPTGGTSITVYEGDATEPA